MNDPKTRKKLLWVAALVGVLLCSLLFISAFSPSPRTATESPRIITSPSGELLLDSLEDSKPATDSESSSGFSLGAGQIVSLAWRLALVVIIIAVSIAGLRWWGKKSQGPSSTTGFLRVVDTLAISNGRTIHLVALGDRVIAVGATTQQLTLLNELTEDEATRVNADLVKPSDQPISQFAAQLFEQMKRSTGRGTPTRSEMVIGEES